MPKRPRRSPRCLAAGDSPVPVVAAKSYFGNLGAASGLVELIGSLLALKHGRLFRTLNYETPDPECPVNVVATAMACPPGDVFINVNISPQGQASAVVVRRFRMSRRLQLLIAAPHIFTGLPDRH